MLGSQRLQYPLIQACSLNHMRDPTILQGIFPCRTLIDPFKEPFGVYSLIKGYWSLWNAGLKEWPGFSTGSQNKGPELSASPRMREGLGYRCLWSEEDFLAVVGGSWCRKRARCGRQAFTSAKQDTGTALSKATTCNRLQSVPKSSLGQSLPRVITRRNRIGFPAASMHIPLQARALQSTSGKKR